LKEENNLLWKQVEKDKDDLSQHNSMVKTIEESAATEIEALKHALAEKDELLQVYALQAEEVRKTHEQTTVTMRVGLEKFAE
jgi:hypothetical protein